MVVDVTAEGVEVEYCFLDEVLHSVPGEHMAWSWEVRPGSAHIARLS